MINNLPLHKQNTIQKLIIDETITTISSLIDVTTPINPQHINPHNIVPFLPMTLVTKAAITTAGIVTI
jgi:hypothetical protein